MSFLRAMEDLEKQYLDEIKDLKKALQAEKERANRTHTQLMEATALLSRHTMALGFLLNHLKAQGMTLEDIDRLTLNALNLARAAAPEGEPKSVS